MRCLVLVSGSEIFCAKRSRAQGESLDASAPGPLRHWLLVEDHGPWGAKEPNALSLLAPELKAAWDALGKTPGLRRLYVRRPKNMPTMPQQERRFWIGTLGEDGVGLVELEAQSLTQFLSSHTNLELDGLAKTGTPVPGMWLVCTHGRRDRCCSLYGTGLFSALDKSYDGEVWQCSHLGGHRFAATALHLPSGYLWGHLSQDDAPALATLRPESPLPLEHKLRGHSGLSAPAQLVDLALRRKKSQWTQPCEPELWTLPHDQAQHRFEGVGELRIEQGEPREVFGSCGDAAPKLRSPRIARWIS